MNYTLDLLPLDTLRERVWKDRNEIQPGGYSRRIIQVLDRVYADLESDYLTKDDVYNYTTGWLDGGQISVNGSDNTKIDITAGSVLIVDYTDQLDPTIETISWEAQTALDPGLSGRSTWVGVINDGSGGAQFVYDIDFDSVERRYTAILGQIWDIGGTGPQITNVGGYERPAWGILTAFQDFILAFGSWNISGNAFSPNGANLLLDKLAGVSYRYHAEDIVGKENIHTDPLQGGITTYNYHIQGNSSTDTQSTLRPDLMDNGAGGTTAVPSDYYTRQEIYFFPVSGTVHVTYGQNAYSSLAECEDAGIEPLNDANKEILDGAIHRASLIMKEDITDLNSALTDVPPDALLIHISAISSGISGEGGDAETVTVMISNQTGYVYITGAEGVEGAQRFSLDEHGVAQIEKYSDEVWQDAELKVAYGTLYFGHNMAASAAGDLLVTHNVAGDNKYLYPRTQFTAEAGTEECKTLTFYRRFTHFPVGNDESQEFVGTSLEYAVGPVWGQQLIDYIYFKVGSVNATSPVSLDIHNGIDKTYPLKFSQRYSHLNWSTKSGAVTATNSPENPGVVRFTKSPTIDVWVGHEMILSGFASNPTYNGTFLVSATDGSTWFEISTILYVSDESGNYFTREFRIRMSEFVDANVSNSAYFVYSSDNPFSLKMSTPWWGPSFPWSAFDIYYAYYDQILGTQEWNGFFPRLEESWFIDHTTRRIYVANSSTPPFSWKSFTFEDDIAHWNELSPFIFSWEKLPSNQNLLIPENHQMAVFGTFEMEGDLILKGSLVLN